MGEKSIAVVCLIGITICAVAETAISNQPLIQALFWLPSMSVATYMVYTIITNKNLYWFKVKNECTTTEDEG
jgi:hypothetical protein